MGLKQRIKGINHHLRDSKNKNMELTQCAGMLELKSMLRERRAIRLILTSNGICHCQGKLLCWLKTGVKSREVGIESGEIFKRAPLVRHVICGG